MAADLVFTCEHATDAVPDPWRARFDTPEGRAALGTHRAYDAGALLLARDLAERFGAPLFAGEVSRLLVDLNRSQGHPRLVSDLARLHDREWPVVTERFWTPYRDAVTHAIRERVERGRSVLHVSVHSFTPVLDGKVRPTDVGLLYDPARESERARCARWKRALARRGAWAVHLNRPYKGVSDGFTTALRTVFPDAAYAGVELEVNQRFVGPGGGFEPALAEAIARSLADALS
jgi:predicted N-formylglutamate amidohydrolase